jgi:hypothetical protein
MEAAAADDSKQPCVLERELGWDDPRMQAQVANMEEEDEDLFVVVGGDGRLCDGVVDYGNKDFRFSSYAAPQLRRILADVDAMAGLRRDCLLCCYPFADTAYWLPANLKPRCSLEALARAMFEEHTKGVAHFDRDRSGVEWWAQIRRPGDQSETIGFHFDKDEQLNTAVEGLFVQPMIA